MSPNKHIPEINPEGDTDRLFKSAPWLKPLKIAAVAVGSAAVIISTIAASFHYLVPDKEAVENNSKAISELTNTQIPSLVLRMNDREKLQSADHDMLVKIAANIEDIKHWIDKQDRAQMYYERKIR